MLLRLRLPSDCPPWLPGRLTKHWRCERGQGPPALLCSASGVSAPPSPPPLPAPSQPLPCQPLRGGKLIPHMLAAAFGDAFGDRLVGTPVRASVPTPRLCAASASLPPTLSRTDRRAPRRLQPSPWLRRFPQERAGCLSGSPCAFPFPWGLRSCVVCCVLSETFASHVLGRFTYSLICKQRASLPPVSIIPGARGLPL